MSACVSPYVSSLCWFASSQQGSSSDRWVAVVSGICRHVENLILSHMISDKVLPLDNGYLLFAFLLYTNTPNGWKDLLLQVQQQTAPRCVMGTCKSKDDVFPDPGSRQQCGQPGTRQAVAGQQLPCFLCIILISPVPSRCGDGPCAASRTDNNISVAL